MHLHNLPSATLLSGFGALTELRPAWERLFHSRSHEPSVSFEWTAAMARNHVRPDDACFLLTLTRNGECVGLIPLVLRSVSLLGVKVRLLAPISAEYNTHSDLLLCDTAPETIDALFEAVRGIRPRFDLFRLARLLEDAPLTGSLTRAAQRAWLPVHERDGLPAYTLDLPQSFAEYLNARSAKFRNYLKRVERKIETAGAAIHTVTDSAQLPAAIDAMLAIERTSWKHSHGSAISAVQRQVGFYQQLCEGAAAAGRLHLQWLNIDGVPAAYNLGYVNDGCYHYLKTSYHSDYRQLSPSTYLRAGLIEALIAGGVTRFDFPGEPYEWESQWTETYRWRRAITVYSRTAKGLLLYGADRARHRAGPRVLTHVDPRAHGARQ